MVTGIWGAVGGLALLAYFAYRLPDISNLSLQERSRSVRLLDRSGQVFATFGAYHGAPLAVDALPPHLAAALVATEDRRFYDHFGIDVIGVARAAMVNFEAGRIRQGGSTLTQQLAKNVFLTPARTLERKVQEVLLALWLEARFSKAELLTIYLNRVYFGAGAYGVTAAADTYFGKSARALTVPEAALLMGLLKAPSSLNVAVNPEGARRSHGPGPRQYGRHRRKERPARRALASACRLCAGPPRPPAITVISPIGRLSGRSPWPGPRPAI